MTKKTSVRLSAAASAQALARIEEVERSLRYQTDRGDRLFAELAVAKNDFERLNKEGVAGQQELQGQIDRLRSSTAKLKAKLFRALTMIAIRDGYIARVLEDNAVKELGADVPAPSIPQPPQPRRMGPAAIDPDEPAPPMPAQDFGRDRPRPPRPWFDF